MPATAILFPGQGSQEPGMGRDLAEADSDSMQLWKKAERISNLPLRAIYWEGGDADMAATQNLQPALTVVNLALWMRLSSRLGSTFANGGAICGAAGHSLGEYSAVAAAGILPLDSVLELVSLRGRLMAQADPNGVGAMAAMVKMPLEAVRSCVAQSVEATGETLVVANYNTPAQHVVSGTQAAVAHARDLAKAAKGRAMPLPVSGAFHSPLMAEAAAEFAEALEVISKGLWQKARFPLFCNADPRPETDPAAIKALLARQMTSSVFWTDTIAVLFATGARSFVECGPKGLLSKMVGPILQEQPVAQTESGPLWTVRNVGNMEQADVFTA